MILTAPLTPAVALLAALSLVNAACYYPNGTDTNLILGTNVYAQCGDSQSRSHSMCCRTNDSADNDTCRSDGLCMNGDLLWRESCTDPLWESEGCVKLCLSGTGNIFGTEERFDMATTHVQIKTCDNGSLCCGSTDSEMAKTCCQKGQGVWLVNGQVVSTNPSSTQSETASVTSSPASFSLNPTSNSTQSSGSNSTKNTVTIVGAVVGGIGGLALVAGAILFFLRRRRTAPTQYKSFPVDNDSDVRGYPSRPVPNTTKYAQQVPVAEMSSSEDTMEMGVRKLPNSTPNELPA